MIEYIIDPIRSDREIVGTGACRNAIESKDRYTIKSYDYMIIHTYIYDYICVTCICVCICIYVRIDRCGLN